ncbi:MAG: hypothetical protein ACIAS6_09640 [Phycisphaerales bacterium JB060]
MLNTQLHSVVYLLIRVWLVIAVCAVPSVVGCAHAPQQANPSPDSLDVSVSPIADAYAPERSGNHSHHVELQFDSADSARAHFLQQMTGIWSMEGKAQMTYSDSEGKSRHENLDFRLLLNLDKSQVIMNWLKLDRPVAHIIADGDTTCYVLLPEYYAYLTNGGELSDTIAASYRSMTGTEAFPLGFDSRDYLLLLGISTRSPDSTWLVQREPTSETDRPFEGVRIVNASTGLTALHSSFTRFRRWPDDIYFPERVFVTTPVQNSRVVLDILSIRRLHEKQAASIKFSIDEWFKTYDNLRVIDLRHPSQRPSP